MIKGKMFSLKDKFKAKQEMKEAVLELAEEQVKPKAKALKVEINKNKKNKKNE